MWRGTKVPNGGASSRFINDTLQAVRLFVVLQPLVTPVKVTVKYISTSSGLQLPCISPTPVKVHRPYYAITHVGHAPFHIVRQYLHPSIIRIHHGVVVWNWWWDSGFEIGAGVQSLSQTGPIHTMSKGPVSDWILSPSIFHAFPLSKRVMRYLLLGIIGQPLSAIALMRSDHTTVSFWFQVNFL